MIGLPAGSRMWLAAGATDKRKEFDSLAAQVQTMPSATTIESRARYQALGSKPSPWLLP
jgi:hypothetical protein